MLWNLITERYERYHLHHVILLTLLIIYSLIGAVVFCALEAQHEERVIEGRYQNAQKARRQMLSAFHAIYNNGQNRSLPPEGRLLAVIGEYNSQMGVQLSRERKWDIWGGLYYAGTIYTTIGYGDLAVTTTGGRIFTVLYAIIGIPLVITILNDWGTILFKLVTYLWTIKIVPLARRIRRKCCRSKQRRGSASESECMLEGGSITPSFESTENGEASLPFSVVVAFFCFWMLICTTTFAFIEDWTMGESAYFFFVSLTTIGFGDMTPRHHVAVANFILILIGLSVVSMTISVIQVQLERIFAEIVMTIDSDFKTRMMDSELKKLSVDLTNAGLIDGQQIGAAQDADFIKGFEKSMHGTDRLLMNFMSNHQKKMLNEKFEDKAKMRNKSTQTNVQIRVASVQTGGQEKLPEYEESDDEEEIVTATGQGGRPVARINPKKKMYIYNTGD